MITEDVLLRELTRQANLVGKMEATMASLMSLLQQPMIEPNRWYALSMVQRCLDDCAKATVPVVAKASLPAAKPNGEDKSQGALALPTPKQLSAAERRRAIMDRAMHPFDKAMRKLPLPG